MLLPAGLMNSSASGPSCSVNSDIGSGGIIRNVNMELKIDLKERCFGDESMIKRLARESEHLFSYSDPSLICLP